MQAKAQLEQQIGAQQQAPLHSSDSDPRETAEWLEAWDQILNEESPERAAYLLNALSERARSAVGKRIRDTLRHIEAHHPSLGHHLHGAVRTGASCIYVPDPSDPRTWTT